MFKTYTCFIYKLKLLVQFWLISSKIVLPSSSTNRIITPPIWRSPRTLNLRSTWRSVTKTVSVQLPSPTTCPPFIILNFICFFFNYNMKIFFSKINDVSLHNTHTTQKNIRYNKNNKNSFLIGKVFSSFCYKKYIKKWHLILYTEKHILFSMSNNVL